MTTRIQILAFLAVLVAVPSAQEKRALNVDDLFALKTVADPRISPDGAWVAYTVTTLDAKEDASDSDIYMVPSGGGEAIRITTGKKPESSPRWSPDGRYLAFLSARDGKKTQVWLIDRRGGEAVQLTDYKANVSSVAWSPDSTRLALIVSDPDPNDPETEGDDRGKEKAPKPIVIRRLQFKRDGQGYLTDIRRHLYVFDVQKKTSTQITSGAYDHAAPAWSPDGRWLAFASNRSPESDANDNSDIFITEASAGATPRLLTSSEGSDTSPVFTADGRAVVYLAGGDPRDIWYATNSVGVVPVGGGPPSMLTDGLDRNASSPRVSADGAAVIFLLEDGGSVHLTRVPLAGGPPIRLVWGGQDIDAFDAGGKGEIVVLESQPHRPSEISLVTGGAPQALPNLQAPPNLKRLTFTNDAWLAGIALGPVQRFTAKSADGTPIDGFLTRPPDQAARNAARRGATLPAVLRIHGGPVSQYSSRFSFEWQLLAAHGYAVVASNPRGSSGYGRAFSRAIFADWGNKDYEDVMAAVDHVVSMGVVDPNRLGVGGWSYGGILTNYVITKTTRFKAAISGASETNYLANYGTDHYQRQWEAELGLPWKNADLWIKLSPWFQVEKIVTPTLILCGANDMNVPLLNSEQLYQALRRLGRVTELVIYPGESHSIRRPSFQKDRYERYIAWYDRYLKPQSTSSP